MRVIYAVAHAPLCSLCAPAVCFQGINNSGSSSWRLNAPHVTATALGLRLGDIDRAGVGRRHDGPFQVSRDPRAYGPRRYPFLRSSHLIFSSNPIPASSILPSLQPAAPAEPGSQTSTPAKPSRRPTPPP
jgi:hypothetical protein